jgi:hypothetical protein
MLLDVSSSNYPITATDITIGSNGIINARVSTITCSGNYNPSLGNFVSGTSTVIMTGISKTLTLAAGQNPYNLQVTGSTILAQDTNVTNSFILSGTLTQNNHWLYYYGDAMILSGGSWDGNLNLTGANAHTVVFTGPMPSWIY